jgi:hypothetical protein
MRPVPSETRSILKDSLHRSVRLECGPDGVRTVVKRFANRSLAGATLDRARAAREHRLLGELVARGVRAPAPLALERVDGGWEVRMQWIEGAHALAEHLSGARAWPAPPERLARELARLLAKLHDAQVDHPDLHPGNVLLDALGRAWAIDFHKARRARRLKPACAWRDLVSLAAGTRECTTPLFRARFLLEWLRAAPRTLAQDVLERAGNSRSALAATLEQHARARRCAAVDKRRARWLRESSACAPLDGERHGFVRREALALVDVSAPERLPRARVLLLRELSEREALAVWSNAARLSEHGLACLRPLALSLRPQRWVALEAPFDGAPVAPGVALEGTRALHSLGKLCAELADRRLRIASGRWPVLWRGARDELALAATSALEADPRGGDGLDLVRVLALAGRHLEQLSQRERAAYAAGILAASRTSPHGRARLRARLRHG